MKRLCLLATPPATLLAALPAFTHPGHGAAQYHARHEHAAVRASPIVAIAAVLAWGALPLAIAIALGAGTAEAGLPL